MAFNDLLRFRRACAAEPLNFTCAQTQASSIKASFRACAIIALRITFPANHTQPTTAGTINQGQAQPTKANHSQLRPTTAWHSRPRQATACRSWPQQLGQHDHSLATPWSQPQLQPGPQPGYIVPRLGPQPFMPPATAWATQYSVLVSAHDVAVIFENVMLMI